MSSASDLFAFPPAVDQSAGTPSHAPVGLRHERIFDPRRTAETGGVPEAGRMDHELVDNFWIPLTLLAAFLQNLRSSLQKSLQPELGTRGATYVRFLFGAPVAILGLLALTQIRGEAIPRPGPLFAGLAMTGGLAQILGTAALLSSFESRNYAAGVAYSKTEPLLAALLGLVILGERVSAEAIGAIGLGVVAVLILTVGTEALRPRLWARLFSDRGAVLGMLAGAGFGLAAVCYRGAGLNLADGDFVLRSIFTLSFVLTFQVILMTLEMYWRDPATLRKVAAFWKRGSLVGLVGATASAGWFSASLLQNAAYVRAFGQVELLFAIGSSVLFFRERLKGRELAGIILLILALVLLLLS